MQLDLFESVIDQVEEEIISASNKFGAFPTAMHGYAVILEELDEMWDEVKAKNIPRAREEAIQVAAMAIQFLIDIR